MSRTNLTIEFCDGFHFYNLNVGYNARTILFLLTNIISPCYILLTVAAVLSRRNIILKTLASHGKTLSSNDVQNSNDAILRAKRVSTVPSLSWSRLPRCWISKRYFVHFYLVGLVSIAIATIYHFIIFSEKLRFDRIDVSILYEMNLIRTVAVVLLVIHMTRRTCECLYVHQYRSESSKMHIMAYLLGVTHYVMLPLVFWDIDVTNNGVGIIGNFNIRDEINSSGSTMIYSATKTRSKTIILILTMIGIILWLQYEQYKHHEILADIRRVDLKHTKRDDDLRRNQHYSLPPCQRWFRYVLSPHYLAEILLYLSFAIMLEMASVNSVENTTECKNTGGNFFENLPFSGRVIYAIFQGRRYRHWTLFGWVATNLSVSAMNSYDWYNSICIAFNTNNKNPKTTSESHQPAAYHHGRRALLPNIL